jgi:uncharacterized membrane protein YdjX (TVP38/TMEM64 family)
MTVTFRSRSSRISLFCFLAGIAFLAFLCWKLDLSLKDLIAWTPDNPWLAMPVILVFYAIKALSIFLPIPLLYLLSGHLFKPWLAIFINALGILVEVSVQYFLGRRRSTDIISREDQKGTLAKIRRLQTDSPFFTSYILRMCQLPVDFVSMFLGSERVSYPWYLLGSLAGMAPVMAGITLLGDDILSPASPHFFKSLGIMILIIVLSFVLFFLFLYFIHPEKLKEVKDIFFKRKQGSGK